MRSHPHKTYLVTLLYPHLIVVFARHLLYLSQLVQSQGYKHNALCLFGPFFMFPVISAPPFCRFACFFTGNAIPVDSVDEVEFLIRKVGIAYGGVPRLVLECHVILLSGFLYGQPFYRHGREGVHAFYRFRSCNDLSLSRLSSRKTVPDSSVFARYATWWVFPSDSK